MPSCGGDKYAKNMLCESMASPYSAKVDFTFADENQTITGKAQIDKDDIICLVFTSPEIYNGVTVKSDYTGKADTVSFELSGIPANVPKSISSDVSLMLSLLSDKAVSKISKLNKESFSKTALASDDGSLMNEVVFEENGVNCKILYDSKSGRPYSIDIGNDEMSKSLVFTHFENTNS